MDKLRIIDKKRIKPLIPTLKILCIISAFCFTSLLVFKDLYFYDWSEKKETIIYSIPMVFLFFYWVKFKLDEDHIFDFRIIGLDAMATILSAVRVMGLLYHSGHVLFLTYTFLTTKSLKYRILCIPMILVTAYFKIVYWSDYVTPILGAGIALVLVYFRNKVNNRLIAFAENT